MGESGTSLTDLVLFGASLKLGQTGTGLGEICAGGGEIARTDAADYLTGTSLGLSQTRLGGSDHIGRGTSRQLLIGSLGLGEGSAGMLDAEQEFGAVKFGQGRALGNLIALGNDNLVHQTRVQEAQLGAADGQNLAVGDHPWGRGRSLGRSSWRGALATNPGARAEQHADDWE